MPPLPPLLLLLLLLLLVSLVLVGAAATSGVADLLLLLLLLLPGMLGRPSIRSSTKSCCPLPLLAAAVTHFLCLLPFLLLLL
jgi:hypothetical protein